jgi:hypothetical protein
MEFAYDLSGGSTAIVKKYQVAASNSIVGRPYLKVAANGSGVALATTTAAADFVGVNIDTAGTYVTGQQSDNSDTARLTSLIINPTAVYRARLSGGATDGTALTAYSVTTASTDGLSVTSTGFDVNSPDLDEGIVWGYSGANSGKARKITSTAANVATVTVAFPYDTAVGDEFLYASVSPLSTIVAQLTTNLTEIDATAAVSGDATIIVVEMILNDKSANGNINSYALIQFADHLLGATVT